MGESKISASMMCADLINLKDTIKIFEDKGVEYLHIDVMDGEFVPNFGLGVDYIRGLRALTKIPLDLHLMIKDPEYKLQWIGIKETDIVSIHCPLNSDSEKMCNKEFFEKMKDGALFINTSRGGVVDEQALIDAVKSKKISGAGLDVVAVEPMEKHEEILDIDNIIITPHSAWAPVETRTRLVEIVKNNIKKWVAGDPVNVIK